LAAAAQQDSCEHGGILDVSNFLNRKAHHFHDKQTSSVFTAGLNAYFTFNVVGFHGSGNVPYKTALACIFIEGAPCFRNVNS
jgi:hypothetical protein